MSATGATAAWTHSHADAANTGFADIATAPASLPARIVQIGEVAVGAGPVIAPDGTVYIGTLRGQLKAFTSGGDLKWSRETPGYLIVASPVIDSDGSIYVVGTRTARDHRSGTVVFRYDSVLYRFDPGGALHWVVPFPVGHPADAGTGATYGPPNIWRVGSEAAIVVPVMHQRFGYELRLVAFSTSGALVGNHSVTTWAHEDITGGADLGEVFCTVVPICLNDIFGLEPTIPIPAATDLPEGTGPPAPGVGIIGSRGTSPVIVVADNHQNVVGYLFSPGSGFQEIFRRHLTNDHIQTSSPTVLSGTLSIIRGNGDEQAWVLSAGPTPSNWLDVELPVSGASPTITANGNLALVTRKRGLAIVGLGPARGFLKITPLEGQSVASAAASCTHVFVSTASSMVTFDSTGQQKMTEFPWKGGGLIPPAIGPNGAVYAVAGEQLHIFPAPAPRRPSLGSAAFTCREPVRDPGSGGVVVP